MEGVDALVSLLRQECSAHPGYVGGPATPTQQQRQSTPPASLSAEAVQSIRQASVKLFGELGLRDYAQFSGWVLPPQAAQAEPAAASDAGAEGEQQQAAEDQQQQQRRAGKSFAELLEIDAAARRQAAAAVAGASSAAGITSADRAGATDTTAEAPASSGSALLDAELAAAAAAGTADGGDYGVYNGIRIDGTFRVTNEEKVEASTGTHRWAAPGTVGAQRCGSGGRGRRESVGQGIAAGLPAEPPARPLWGAGCAAELPGKSMFTTPPSLLSHPARRPIPMGPPPEPVVEALEDVADLPAQLLCQLGGGQVVAFSQLRCVGGWGWGGLGGGACRRGRVPGSWHQHRGVALVHAWSPAACACNTVSSGASSLCCAASPARPCHAATSPVAASFPTWAARPACCASRQRPRASRRRPCCGT